MKGLAVEASPLEGSIKRLKGMEEVHSQKAAAELSFQGDFSFLNTVQRLNTVMEQSRVLWYQAAGYEGKLLEQMKQQILEREKMLSKGMGIRYE